MYRTRLQHARLQLRGSPSATVLARRTRLSVGTVSQIERGEMRPGAKARGRLIRSLNLRQRTFDHFWLLARQEYLLREQSAVSMQLAEIESARKRRNLFP